MKELWDSLIVRWIIIILALLLFGTLIITWFVNKLKDLLPNPNLPSGSKVDSDPTSYDPSNSTPNDTKLAGIANNYVDLCNAYKPPFSREYGDFLETILEKLSSDQINWVNDYLKTKTKKTIRQWHSEQWFGYSQNQDEAFKLFLGRYGITS